jgi:2-methylisocitrate lyase-like PEP mutase family enzyme
VREQDRRPLEHGGASRNRSDASLSGRVAASGSIGVAVAIREARSALTAAGRACAAAARADVTYPAVVGPALLESIHRFVRTVEGNVHLARVVNDGTQSYHQEIAPLTAEKVRALGVAANTLGVMGMRAAIESTRNILATVRTSCLLLNRVHPTAK